ncbi:LuxR C-terminal-related transcriptional regulator [Pseudomonas sp. IT-P176]|uniref:helix-turn-helix transcriptional regulator n=1 Tax=Pseudomonas sp. IT-P176 TaxID=3026444 RepID=UPI0039DF6235
MFVPRPHLCTLLRREQRRLQLLCAPPGFGKTQLLRHYLEPVTNVVWLALGGQPQTLQTCSAKLAEALGLSSQSSPEALLAWIERAGTLHLVFDDVPAFMPAELNLWFDRLLALANPRLQVLVTCRRRPDWNLARLVLMGQLLELDARQLALRREESDALVSLLAPDSDTIIRQQLWQATAGWCAGLRLLLPAFVTQTYRPEQPHAVLVQYLERELLARLTEDQQQVLFGLAHLSKASAELCEQLWEGQGGARVFTQLNDCQALLIPLEHQPQWSCLIPAVAQALQERLPAAPLNRLRLRACQALSALGHLDDAIEQALRAEQPEVAASYMEGLWLTWILREQHLGRLMTWRERMAPHLLESSPRLIYLSAKALLFSGRLDEAQACLQQLSRFLPLPNPRRNQRLLANWQALFGTLHALRGDSEQARLHCQAARQQLNREDWLSILLCHCMLARDAMHRGELTEAQALLEQSLELARRQGSREAEVLVNSDRARLLMLQGHAHQAQSLLHSELEHMAGTRTVACPLRGRLLLQQAELSVQQGRLGEAEQRVHEGLVQVGDCCAPFVLSAYLLLAQIAAHGQAFDQAQLHLDEAERRMHWARIDRACYQRPIAEHRHRVQRLEREASAQRLESRSSVPDYQDGLTPREVSVLKLLAEGMSVREVGSRLFISVNTVKTHAKNINVKLGACRRTQAINSAKAMGILA